MNKWVLRNLDEHIQQLNTRLIVAGIQSELDISKEKLNYKTCNFSNQKVPIIAIIGKKEQEAGTVTLRCLGIEEQITVTVDELIEIVPTENKKYLY